MSNQKWGVLDCGKIPSDMNCKLKMMAPMNDIDSLVECGVFHACAVHGHEDNKELRDMIRSGVEYEVR